MPADSAGPERRFRLSPAVTFGALVFAALCVRLGFWQWHRGVERQEAWERFARGADRLLDLDAREAPRDTAGVALYQLVRVSGTLDGAHQFLLDNRTSRGRAGYEVLTPLAREGAPALLVDRGWVPFTGTRARLPDVTLETAGPVTLTGRMAELPVAGLASGRAAPDTSSRWPKVTSYPTLAEVVEALREPLAPRILLLDPGSPAGFVREWQPPGLPPLRHFAYAIQYWIFAALTLAVWAVMTVRAIGRGRAIGGRA